MRERNIRRLRESGVVVDAALLSGQPDMRQGIGLFAFMEQSMPALDRLIADVSSVFADQICYTLSPTPADNFGRIHFTFFQFLKVDSIPSDFSQKDKQIYENITASVLASMKPFTITYKGVMAIPTGLLIYGYPSYDVNPYRERLRTELIQSKVHFIEAYKSDIVHSTILRVAARLDPQLLIEFARTYDGQELFSTTVHKIQLGFGSWRMRDEEIQMIETFDLKV
ncbi:MAG: hypothetical protein RI947_678 [Candidatus Parcubacteria bacterium]